MNTTIDFNGNKTYFYVKFLPTAETGIRKACEIGYETRNENGELTEQEGSYTARGIGNQMIALMMKADEYAASYNANVTRYNVAGRDPATATAEEKYNWENQDRTLENGAKIVSCYLYAAKYLVHLAGQLDESRNYQDMAPEKDIFMGVIKEALEAYNEVIFG